MAYDLLYEIFGPVTNMFGKFRRKIVINKVVIKFIICKKS